jgi:membrane protease YdiL (CAAX protease family)
MRTEMRPRIWFFLIACVPPWIGWSLLRFGVVPSSGAWQALYLTGWAASAAGLIATYMEEGAAGVRRLLREFVRFSVPLRWWLFVVIVPIVAVVGGILLYVAVSGNGVGFAPSQLLALVAPSMLVTLLLGPFGEEFGWRGYLLPRLAKEFSALAAVLIVGMIWAIWHWPLLSYDNFAAAPGRQVAIFVVGATYMSLVIGTVYLRSGSLLLAVLMHWWINNVRDIADRVFPGLPEADPLLQWCAIVANLAVAAVAAPALLAANRDKRSAASGIPRELLERADT